MAAKRNLSYAWARHVAVALTDPDELSDEAYEGLEYARDLTFRAEERGRHALRHERLDPPFTINDLALQYDLPAKTISKSIALARRELFGNLSDPAIYKRVQRQDDRPTSRVCHQLGCGKRLPDSAHANRHYCTKHRSPKERARRSRAQKKTILASPLS
jgi:hypothetical protein